MSDFEYLGLKAGNWSGLLHRATAPQRVGLVQNGELVAQARVTAVKDGTWRLDVDLPADRLGEGVTTVGIPVAMGVIVFTVALTAISPPLITVSAFMEAAS